MTHPTLNRPTTVVGPAEPGPTLSPGARAELERHNYVVVFLPDIPSTSGDVDSMDKISVQLPRAEAFRALHDHGTFVLPNAWDVASAAVMAGAGAPAIATTSSGISWSLGVPDGERLTRGEMVAATERIVRAVGIPVTADVESGYGPDPKDVTATVAAAIDAGAVGANLEDSPGPAGLPLRPIDVQCERLAAARATADRYLPNFIINARTDVFLADVGAPRERVRLVLERAQRYHDAGADCLFVPGLVDPEMIAALIVESPLPINIMLAPAEGPSITQLVELGVRRITLGSFIACAAYGTAARIARDLAVGQTPAATDATPHGDLQELLGQLIAAV
jgi:2-methylisocitrate lyase-like PEP mutase family enzyme